MSKRTCFMFQPIFQYFFRYTGWPEGPETDIVASDDRVSHLICRVFDYTSWRSSALLGLFLLGLFTSLRRPKSVTTCSSIFCPFTGSAEMSPLDFTGTVNSKLECFLTWLQLRPLSFLSRLLFYVFWNHLDKLYICKGDDPLSSFHVYLLISSIGLPYFHRKKGEQFTTVTYLSVLSTLNKSNIN